MKRVKILKHSRSYKLKMAMATNKMAYINVMWINSNENSILQNCWNSNKTCCFCMWFKSEISFKTHVESSHSNDGFVDGFDDEKLWSRDAWAYQVSDHCKFSLHKTDRDRVYFMALNILRRSHIVGRSPTNPTICLQISYPFF